MFFWKFTRSGRISSKYISLILDFHSSQIEGNFLLSNFEECKDILLLIHDVETLNGKVNYTAGLEKQPFQEQVNKLGYMASNSYVEKRHDTGLVIGQMTLGTHNGSPLDYGFSNKNSGQILLDISKLKWGMNIDAITGKGYGSEDKLKAYRNIPMFVNQGFYYDLMPMHSCIIEIINKMLIFDKSETIKFLETELKWRRFNG